MVRRINFAVFIQYVIVLSGFSHLAIAGTMLKPHVNTGILEKYDGRHIPYTITFEENEKLEAGLPVSLLLSRVATLSYSLLTSLFS